MKKSFMTVLVLMFTILQFNVVNASDLIHSYVQSAKGYLVDSSDRCVQSGFMTDGEKPLECGGMMLVSHTLPGKAEVLNKDVKKITLSSKMLFSFDSAVLNEDAKKSILETIKLLNDAHFKLTSLVAISGHADSTGPERYNLLLSERRAKAVSLFIKTNSAGIEMSLMKVNGYGESMPFTSNATSEGRQLNRRVEIYAEGVRK